MLANVFYALANVFTSVPVNGVRTGVRVLGCVAGHMRVWLGARVRHAWRACVRAHAFAGALASALLVVCLYAS